MSLRVGSLVFATEQGLGYLAKSFFDNGVVTSVMVVRHGKRPERDNWYPSYDRISSLKGDAGSIRKWCNEIDVLLAFETPFDWSLFDYCRQIGVKTVLMSMYECMPKELPSQPDMFLCPSLLDLQYYRGGEAYGRAVYLPVPVDVPWRQRTRAEVFVHNAGHGGLKGRNGTRELIEAWRMVKSPAGLVIRSQERIELTKYERESEYGMAIYLENGTVPYETLYQEGDVFVFPEKFNGLSLPLQEARAAGMLVMATDRFPMNTWLPREPLILPDDFRTNCVSSRCHDFEEAVVNPLDIAAKIDEWYNRDISAYSLQGREWAEQNSWAVLKPKYVEILEELVRS